MSLLARIKQARVRAAQALARLEDRLPRVAVHVAVEPFSWRFSAEVDRYHRDVWSGRRWEAALNVGPFGAAASLELPRRKEEDPDA